MQGLFPQALSHDGMTDQGWQCAVVAALHVEGSCNSVLLLFSQTLLAPTKLFDRRLPVSQATDCT